MKVLLLTPPLLQPNTPYAATPLLTAWLRSQGHDAVQADLSIELLLKFFSKEGLRALFQALKPVEEAAGFLEQADEYLETIEPVIAFLQGKTEVLDCDLPEGPYLARGLDQEEELGWEFREISPDDQDRYLASLYLDDVAEAFKMADPHFGFSRYAEQISVSVLSFGELRDEVVTASLFSNELIGLTDQVMNRHQPEMVALTIPFPGCLVGALTIAKRIKQTCPKTIIVLGGGYVNTELRELTDPEIFDFVDYICLDSGMTPLLRIANHAPPVRTFVREEGNVRFYVDDTQPVLHNDLPSPVFDGLPLEDYFGMFEVLNPVTRLWSDGRWNKLVLAHGCCWGRCAFCDTSVDYICRYDPATPATICDWMESMMADSGFNGFHFVDEAMPSDLIDGLCDEIVKRDLDVEWWGNIRFEKRLSKALIQKMATAGCLAVTGGLETCCERTLQLMRKGITVEGAEKVLWDFAEAGIMTHAYLMYGFPTQTLDETFQGLEIVRQLVERGALHSAFWHRFALTAHSEIAHAPEQFSIRLLPEERTGFARNEIPFDGGFDYDLNKIGGVLRRATYNYQLGLGLDLPVEHWREA